MIKAYFFVSNLHKIEAHIVSTCIKLNPTGVLHCAGVNLTQDTGSLVIDHIKGGSCGGHNYRGRCGSHNRKRLITIVTFLSQVQLTVTFSIITSLCIKETNVNRSMVFNFITLKYLSKTVLIRSFRNIIIISDTSRTCHCPITNIQLLRSITVTGVRY